MARVTTAPMRTECGSGLGVGMEADGALTTSLGASSGRTFVELSSTRAVKSGLYHPTLASTNEAAASRHRTAPRAVSRTWRAQFLNCIQRFYHSRFFGLSWGESRHAVDVRGSVSL